MKMSIKIAMLALALPLFSLASDLEMEFDYRCVANKTTDARYNPEQIVVHGDINFEYRSREKMGNRYYAWGEAVIEHFNYRRGERDRSFHHADDFMGYALASATSDGWTSFQAGMTLEDPHELPGLNRGRIYLQRKDGLGRVKLFYLGAKYVGSCEFIRRDRAEAPYRRGGHKPIFE